MFIGALVGPLIKEKDWGSTRYPKFHCVDFLEFVDVLAQWVSAIQDSYCKDKAAQNVLSSSALQDLICPLTFLEMQLLLRAVIMAAFKDTQAGVQGLYPFTPTSSTDNQFVPFIASAGTCNIACPDMKLPLAFVENIRSLVARHIEHKPGYAEWFIPILGKYALTELNPATYTFQYAFTDQPVQTLPSFTLPTGIYRENLIDSKTKKTMSKLLNEQPISLIDGAYASGYVAINDTTRLQALSTRWNAWLEQNGLATYSMSLTPLSTDLGVNVLCSVSMTRIVNKVTPQAKERAQQIIDVRSERHAERVCVLNEYNDLQSVAELSQGVILSSPYEMVLKSWILPTVRLEVEGTSFITAQKWQGLMVEPYQIITTAGEQGRSLSYMHSSYASQMVKANLERKNSWEEFFVEMAKLGRGGILSGLVAKMVGSAVPQLSGIADVISDALPI